MVHSARLDRVQSTPRLEPNPHPQRPNSMRGNYPTIHILLGCIPNTWTERALRVFCTEYACNPPGPNLYTYAVQIKSRTTQAPTIRHKGTAAAKLQLSGAMGNRPIGAWNSAFSLANCPSHPRIGCLRSRTAILSLVPEYRWVCHAELLHGRGQSHLRGLPSQARRRTNHAASDAIVSRDSVPL